MKPALLIASGASRGLCARPHLRAGEARRLGVRCQGSRSKRSARPAA